MKGSGKGGNNRKNRQRFSGRKDEAQKHDRKKYSENLHTDGKLEKNRIGLHERPRWTAPKPPATPIPIPDCPWCKKPIKDIAAAFSDKSTGVPVHFDCVIARISEIETLETNDKVCYIGGGRFGVVHYSSPQDARSFCIKSIYEWENKEDRKDWRSSISEHFSIT